MLFNEKLKMLRKERGLTQEELAEELCVSRQAITKWESGEGIPDIENLKQISILFNTSIDELVKEDKDIDIEEKASFLFTKELEIDHSKHFDIHINKIYELSIISNNEEKVKVELISNIEVEDDCKVKFDNLYNRLDIDIKNKKTVEDSKINIYIPMKYLDEMEIKSNIKTLNITDLELEKLEYDGKLKYLNVLNTTGKIVLNSTKCDVEAKYDKLDGTLEVNTINSTTRVELPKNSSYKTVLKGFKNKFVDTNSDEESNNTIELNGIGSKLIVIEK